VFEDPELTVTLPAAPSLLAIDVAPFGGITMPTAPDDVVALTAVAPSIREYVPGAQYTSSLLTNLKSYLEDVIVNGGTGLNPDVENAIWDRGREREAKSRADALRDLEKLEEQGFALPSGVYLDARLKIATESDYVNRGLSREIMIKQAKAQVNTALVTQYQAQVQAALSAVDIYKARIEGIRIKADIEKTKVEIYGEQIKGYVAKINAYTAGVEGYRASLEAEGVKQKVYQSQVEAFSARVGAAAKEADIRIAAYRGRLDANLALWEGYKAQYAGEASKAQAISAFNSSLADEFKSEVTAVTSYNETLTKQWQVAIDQAQRVSEIGISAAKANAELYVTTRSLALDAAKVGAQVSAQLGAAALNAINWSTSISTSSATGYSESYSGSQARSVSDSTNTNYNYSASV
jgi:hypothetical protein